MEHSSGSSGTPVVASLGHRSTHPYSSIALSPSRQYAVAAANDTLTVLSVGPLGLSEVRSLRVSQQFQAPPATASSDQNSSSSRSSQHGKRMDIRDTFGYPKQTRSTQNNMTNTTNVTITHVVWSPLKNKGGDNEDNNDHWVSEKDSFLAAAGSNGVFCIWNASRAFLEGSDSVSTSMGYPPDAVRSHSSRAVNRLAWHPKGKYSGHLLTASQDGTVKLWVRKPLATSSKTANEQRSKHDNAPHRSWFRHNKHASGPSNHQSYSWECSKTFSPRSEAIREVRWSPFHDDIFALVTDSGHLIVYNINIPEAPWDKIAAHGTGASTLDWHPTRPYVIATGGIADRSVKIWDLAKKDEAYRTQNSNTATSVQSEKSCRSAITDESPNEETGSARDISQFDFIQPGRSISLDKGGGSVGPSRAISLGASHHGGRARPPIHVLSISAAVTRLAWRPPAFSYSRDDAADLALTDPHDGMIAIATEPVKGRAGGNGLLSLWSHHRPFMALSVVEGHKEGAVTDFRWLDTPRKITSHTMGVPAHGQLFKRHYYDEHSRSNAHPQRSESRGRASLEDLTHSPSLHVGLPLGVRRAQSGSDDDLLNFEEKGQESGRLAGNVWQHVLSVGRDGRCLIQSFARGERPISQVSPSCFAMAELSPFQRGCGSLQIFSVHQRVPAGPAYDFLLTGLRRDAVTAIAPGIFAEVPLETNKDEKLVDTMEYPIAGVRHPSTMPQLVFNVVDQGDLDEDGYPISPQSSTICVAPEVVHLSRFAESYQLYPDERCPTRVGLLLLNANVAERLQCGPLSRMWRMLASLLKGSGLDELPGNDSPPRNAMQFALLPTLRSLLEERANAGDVQTCVALCEVLQVIELGSDARTKTTRVPGLELSLVREWYLSFIDILHQMCLFSHASFLIGHCNDASIGELTQQSTTIDEACPLCGKPILGGDDSGAGTNGFSPRRVCRSCGRRIGFCFLCHEPVKGVYVLCPGCGHGGHLDHALEWFGGLGGTPVREVCPTGCGHRCNLAQQLTAFPRTESQIFCFPVSDQELQFCRNKSI